MRRNEKNLILLVAGITILAVGIVGFVQANSDLTAFIFWQKSPASVPVMTKFKENEIKGAVFAADPFYPRTDVIIQAPVIAIDKIFQDLKLTGIFVKKNKCFAILNDPSENADKWIRSGDKLHQVITVKNITDRNVVIELKGVKKILEL